MKFPSPLSLVPETFKKMSIIELFLLAIFIAYIALPINAPSFLARMINSPIGFVSIFIVTIYLFFYANPVLAVLYVVVAYELIRRSSIVAPKLIPTIQHVPSQQKKDVELKVMNAPVETTLEETVVQKMAPIGKSETSVYTPSSFKPVSDNVGSASMF